MNELKLPDDPRVAKEVLQNAEKRDRRRIESGWLGIVFGTGRNAPVPVLSLITLILLIAALAYTFSGERSGYLPVADFWKIIAPILTTLIGYLVGTTTARSGGDKD